jgi:hypothetical protein
MDLEDCPEGGKEGNQVNFDGCSPFWAGAIRTFGMALASNGGLRNYTHRAGE